MQLICLGSGSSGNCYLLENKNECLILEAGIPFKAVKTSIDFEVGKIVGVIASHSHSDHFGYAQEYLKAGIPVYASEQTHAAIPDYINKEIMLPGYWYRLSQYRERGFTITPFSVVHDVECYGFIIEHEDIGKMLFCTDTEYVKQNFKGIRLNHILIECNYSQKIIDSRVSQGNTVKGLRDRVLQSHMELETCKTFIESNKTSNLMTIILLHLSDCNSDEKIFKEEIQNIAGSGTRVFIADKNLKVKLDSLPFT